MPRGRSQIPSYYVHCPENDMSQMQRNHCYSDTYGKLDGPCGMVVSEFKSPMMAHSDPQPPPPKKKRRTSNTMAAAAAAAQPQSSSMMQDLLPPPLTGYGDTIVASNPFDDTPPSTPSMSHMNPMNQVNKHMSPGAPPMMGSISPCHIVGSPMNCDPNIGSPINCGSPLGRCSPMGGGGSNGSCGPMGSSHPSCNSRQLSRSPLVCPPMNCGPANSPLSVINMKPNVNMPPVSCGMSINSPCSRQSDMNMPCGPGINNPHCNPLLNNAQCNPGLNNLSCIGNGINRQQCGNMMGMGNIPYDGMNPQCRPNMNRSQFLRGLPNVHHYPNGMNGPMNNMCGPPEMGNLLCGPNNNMNNLHCVGDSNPMNNPQCMSNNMNVQCSDANTMFSSQYNQFDMNPRCSPNLNFNPTDMGMNNPFYRPNVNNHCVPNVHTTVCNVPNSSDVLTDVTDNIINSVRTKDANDCRTNLSSNAITNVVGGVCGINSGANNSVNDDLNLISCQNESFDRISENEDRKPNIKDCNNSILNDEETDGKFPETNTNKNDMRDNKINIKGISEEFKHELKREPSNNSDDSTVSKIIATSSTTDSNTTMTTNVAGTCTSTTISANSTTAGINTCNSTSVSTMNIVGTNDSNNNNESIPNSSNSNDKNSSNDEDDFNMYRNNSINNDNNVSNNEKESTSEDMDSARSEIDAIKHEPEKHFKSINASDSEFCSNDGKNRDDKNNIADRNNDKTINNTNNSCNDNENSGNEMQRSKESLNPSNVWIKIENDDFEESSGNKNEMIRGNGNVIPNTTSFNAQIANDVSNVMTNSSSCMNESMCGSPVLPSMSRPPMHNTLNNSISYSNTRPMSMFSGKVYPANKSKVFNPQNPNAPPIYACGICHKEVNDNDQAVMCESGCNFWYHTVCSGLTDAAYHMLKKEVYAEWACDNCLQSKSIPLVKHKP